MNTVLLVPFCLGVVAAISGAHGVAAEEATAPAVVRALEATELSTPLTAQINELPLRAGQAFDAGDVLIGFDCARYEAEKDEAEAALSGAAARHAINVRLSSYQALGAGELQVSQAEVEGAKARVAAIDATLADCTVIAPYDGQVVSVATSRFAMPRAGAPLMNILQSDNLVVELIVPSMWLRWLSAGQPVQVEVRETGQRLMAVVDRIGPAVDPVSQTIDVYAVFEQAAPSVRPGMSGLAIFDAPTEQGALR